MMQQFKLLAFDLDHTLLKEDGTLAEPTIQVLKTLHESGIKIVLCSGRPVPGLTHLNAQLGLTQPGDYSVYFNGGLVKENATGETIFSQTMPEPVVQDVIRVGDQFQVPIDLVSANAVYAITDHGESRYPLVAPHGMPFMFYPSNELPEDHASVYKCAVAAQPTVVDQLQNGVHVDGVSVTRSRRELLELMPAGINKRVGLEHLLEHLGYGVENLMVFGDEENDREMMLFAGLSIAVGNAIPAIKSIADRVTDTNEENGVANFLKKYFYL